MRDFGKLRSSEFGCARCREVFGNLTLFDGHQAVAQTPACTVSCMGSEALAAAGLVRDNRGTWQTQAGLLQRAERATRMAVRNKERHVDAAA